MNLSKKIVLSIISSAIFSSVYASDSDTLTFSGTAKLAQQQFTNLKVNGKMEAESISASGLITVSGSAEISNSKLHNLRSSGTITLKNNQINGNINTSGSLKVSQSILSGGELSTNGGINSDNSTYLTTIKLSGKLSSEADQFNARISGSGSIYAKDSKFKQEINLSSTKSSWSNSLINANIIIENKEHLLSNTPTLIFANTQINGDIIFRHTKGLIILSGTSKINGQVTNAEVKYE